MNIDSITGTLSKESKPNGTELTGKKYRITSAQ
jgi:hypothetical protein